MSLENAVSITPEGFDVGRYRLGGGSTENYVYKSTLGINQKIVRDMSAMKGEPQWMLDIRLRALAFFKKCPMPNWGGDMAEIDFDDICYYSKPTKGQANNGSDLPDATNDGYESEAVFHRNQIELERQGVLFTDMNTALVEYPELVQQYFGTIIPPNDNKFSSLNTSVWSGGSFIYVPPGVQVEMPLQAHFRTNAQDRGRFERTLIIADEGSQVHYIEGCSAPVYTSESLRSGVVEIIVKPGAHVTYTTIQNWSSNVYNLVTKRAYVETEGRMEWIDGNIGSRLTMMYPAIWLAGPKASGEVRSVAYAGVGQHHDTGAKLVHAAPETHSTILSKSISKGGGRSAYRGLVRVEDHAFGCKSDVQCDSLLLDDESVSNTYPHLEIGSTDALVGHAVTCSKVADAQLFYLMSRGLSEEQAIGMVVNGFIEPVTRTLPMEYAVEWSRLIELQMLGSIG